jgi:hypothetical protein
MLKLKASLPADNLQVTHAAGAGGLPPLGLDGPVELPDPGLGIPAAGALLLLDVERDLKDTNLCRLNVKR